MTLNSNIASSAMGRQGENLPPAPSPEAEDWSGSGVQNLLKEWRQNTPVRHLREAGIEYHRFYNMSNSVSLCNFSLLADVALRLDGISPTPHGEWRSSQRLAQITNLWLADSTTLKRPYPVSVFIMNAELAHLLDTGSAAPSTTFVLTSYGLTPSAVASLARYQKTEFSQLAPAIESIDKILNQKLFAGNFKKAWSSLPSVIDNAMMPIRTGLLKIGYDTQDLAEIFSETKPGVDRILVSRCLSGALLYSGVGPGCLEFLAHRDVAAITEGLVRQLSLAQELRQRKGRFDPHPSVLLRDIFGIQDNRIEGFPASQVMTLESRRNYHLPLTSAVLRESARVIHSVLPKALENRLEREPFIETNSFFEVIARLSRGQLLAKGVLGKSRSELLLDGKYVPPLSQVYKLLEETGVPAFLEARYRILYADSKSGQLNAAQRFVDSLCEENAESRNAYRISRETEQNPWVKSAFERFFHSLAGGPNEIRSHLRRIVAGLPPGDESRHSVLTVLQHAFADQISNGHKVSYIDAVQTVCSESSRFGTWIDMHLELASRLLRTGLVLEEAHLDPADPQSVFNQLQTVTCPPQNANRHSAWESLRTILAALPGITLSELRQLSDVREIVDTPEPAPVPPVHFDVEAIILNAMDKALSFQFASESGNLSESSTHEVSLDAPPIILPGPSETEYQAHDQGLDTLSVPLRTKELEAEADLNPDQHSVQDPIALELPAEPSEELDPVTAFVPEVSGDNLNSEPEGDLAETSESSDLNLHPANRANDQEDIDPDEANAEPPKDHGEAPPGSEVSRAAAEDAGSIPVEKDGQDRASQQKKRRSSKMGASKTDEKTDIEEGAQKRSSAKANKHRGSRSEAALDPERARLLELYIERHAKGLPIFEDKD